MAVVMLWRCDRCGVEVGSGERHVLRLTTPRAVQDELSARAEDDVQVDLCPSCVDVAHIFLGGGKVR